jgi:hypothetical protein
MSKEIPRARLKIGNKVIGGALRHWRAVSGHALYGHGLHVGVRHAHVRQAAVAAQYSHS